MAPLTGPAVQKLAGILCDLFQPESELEKLVQVTLNRGLFTDFAGPHQPLRTVAFQLVTALEQEGLTAPLLHGALRASNRNPLLVEFCERLAPDLLKDQPPAAQQVASVVGGLNAVRARLADPGVRTAVVASRDQLEQIGDRTLRLDLYKRLHDGLHLIQVSYFRQVLDVIRRFKTDATAADTLDEYVSGLQTLSVQAAATAAAFPADGSGAREEELRWVTDLDREVIGKLQQALRAGDVKPAREAAGRLKTLLNFESARVNHALTEVARQLPLNRLIDTLRRVAESAVGAGPDGDPLRAGLDGLRQLYPRLIGQVAVHTQWQRVENALWLVGNDPDEGTADQRADFADVQWPTIKADVQALINLDREADWARDLSGRVAEMDAALQGPDPARLREAFRRFRRQAMLRFFQVDLNLRELCGEIAPIGDPVTALLEEAKYGDG